MMRLCPNCETERNPAELACEGEVDGQICGWDLTGVSLKPSGWRPKLVEPAPPSSPQVTCRNGHPAEPGDLICGVCGEDIGELTPAPSHDAAEGEDAATEVNGWRLESRIAETAVGEQFLASQAPDGRQGVLTLYGEGKEPNHEVYEVLRTLPREHVPEVIETGHWRERAYEVSEDLRAGTLADLGLLPDDLTTLSKIVEEIGGALHALGENGLRHRDLHPGAILVRASDPLDLVITNFGSARLSEFDLDIVSPLEVTRYTAPEALAGGVAAASDWWSLGMLLLEQVTRGTCFEGVNDQAFLIHVVTNGAPIPTGLQPRVELLLRGLLALDRRERWGWDEASRWLAGEALEAPASGAARAEARGRQTLSLGGALYATPSAFALAAAHVEAWDEAKALLLRGGLGTWIQDAGFEPRLASELRKLLDLQDISDDIRLGLALKVLNPAMPLASRGEIVTPGWLLDNPSEGYALITGPAPDWLAAREAEPWLGRLKARAQTVRDRAGQLGVALNETELQVHLLSTSKSRLAAIWADRRQLLPDTDHPGLIAILERRQTAEEDFILLLSADVGQFRTTGVIVEEAHETARRAGLESFDVEEARAWLAEPRREIYLAIEDRLEGFARSGFDRIDEWADQFRLERRLPIDRALALLAVPDEAWREPPRQTYVATLLDFFAKRITGSVMRGPLTRMVIGKTTARLDLTELGSERRSSRHLLDHLLLRNDQPFELDPEVLTLDPRVERRLRTLHSHATLYRRDTGIDGLYLGFPFLVMQEAKASVRPRIAPVLLWPIKLRAEVGARGRIAVAFDHDREEVRLNPAFDTLLGPDAASRWNDAARELLGRASLNAASVMEAFEDLVKVIQGLELAALPNKDVRVRPGEDELVCAGALFHLAYFGQAVMEDLRQLKAIPPSGSSLETALRVGEPPSRPQYQRPSELDRFFTAPSDPSQERAVIEARSGSGLLIEGPPGTGKSQTIVNMVADAIGRDQSLLIVCQKQAALEVVHKRLEAEGLGDRIVMINDVNKDRMPVLRAFREQLYRLFAKLPGPQAWRPLRQQQASRIEALEADLDRHHAALHAYDPPTGSSYRLILSDLIGFDEAARPAIQVPELRRLLSQLDVAGVASLQETCGPLARLWLPARFEDSPLADLKAFSADEGTAKAFRSDLSALIHAEKERDALVARTPGALSMDDPAPFHAWEAEHASTVLNQSEDARERLKRWLELVRDPASVDPLLTELADVAAGLGALPDWQTLSNASRFAIGLEDGALAEWANLADALARPPSFFQRLSVGRWLSGRKLKALLRERSIESAPQLRQALHDEIALRPWRARLAQAQRRLSEPTSELDELSPNALKVLAETSLEELASAKSIALRIALHPHPQSAFTAVAQGSREAVEAWLSLHGQGYARHEARGLSLAALVQMETWLEAEWTGARRKAIEVDTTNATALTAMEQAASTVLAYQRFRPRAAQLDESALATFRALRSHQDAFAAVPEADLDDEVRRTIGRESRLAWKQRLESQHPELLFDATELRSKALALSIADQEMRRLNRRLLTDGVEISKISAEREWEDITRLTGQRARRLREFLDRGADMGLMRLRPVWLMNPDVASRLLPLKKALFDTVIYDEASQMPIEYALPSLFRSRRMIVSGDEKQMPPTNFFSSKIESDEAEIFEGDEADDLASEAEREEFTETWNRREIKDCPDLLQLAKTVLPTTTLQIHYRSTYRELIQFSNAAFYQGHLSVPARHPDAEVRRAQPLELIRVDGIYEDQTNRAEAERVADVLAGAWRAPYEARHSIGVVTFNRKQADLIDEVLELRAEIDPAFRAALAQEREREDGGEDMGFFVKNVENVQGDERDLIIFSSTFGRNGQGAFRRSFGVLGQTGGERRLNVAVTRAREKVILVTSMPISEISDLLATKRSAASPRDYLQAYFEYARASSAGELENARGLLARLSSERHSRQAGEDLEADGFQHAVASYVGSLGFTPQPVGDDGAFGLDFAIEDPRTGLYGIGIECDAPRHSLLAEARAREMWRPAVLKRSIPEVHRVSSHAWFHSPDTEKLRLRNAIQKALGQETAA